MKKLKKTGLLHFILFTGVVFTLKAQDIEQLMKMSIHDIMNTQIYSASKKAETVFDSPVSSSVLTREEILNAGVTSIMEAMRLIPGVIVREQTNGIYDIHLRGFDNIPPNGMWSNTVNNITLLMVDNRIAYNYLNGGIFWEHLPIDLIDVERIEVVRGPASALYGPNAVAGVIHIITRRSEKEGVNVSGNLQAGTYQTKIGNMAVGYKKGALGARMSVNAQQRNRYESEYYILGDNSYEELPDSVRSMVMGSYTKGLRNQYPDPDLAMNKYGFNAVLTYQPDENIMFDISGGFQESRVQNMFVDIGAISFKTEDATSRYVNFSGQVHDLITRVSFTTGEYHWLFGTVDENNYSTLDAEAEYDLHLNRIHLRPGLSYKKAEYEFSGMRGKHAISTLGLSLRTDYQSDHYRFIAALRADKYSAPDELYPSYQLALTRALGENHQIRAVLSKANRAAFLADAYFYMDIPLPPFVGNSMLLLGNENLKLLTMDMLELGYRAKLSNTIQMDIELFHARTKDYDDIYETGETEVRNGLTYSVNRYQNLDLTATQNGATISMNWLPKQSFQAKFFITVQQSDLTDFAYDIDNDPDATTDRKHEQTPDYYGGLILNIKPVSRLNLNTHCYYYGSQVFDHEDYIFSVPFQPGIVISSLHNMDIESKILINLNATWHLTSKIDLFINARNISGADSQEFGFADNIGSLYLAGLRFEY